MISNYIINATLKKNTISVQNAIHLLNHSGGLQLRSNITNKVKNSNDKKWFNNIDTICRGRNDIQSKINAICLLEETIIQLENGVGNYEIAKKYCDLLLYLLRQNENIRTRSYAAIVFARLMKVTSSTQLVDVRKSGGNYANLALPLLVHMINNNNNNHNNDDDNINNNMFQDTDIKMISLYTMCCIMEYYPASTRNPPRKMVKTINSMIDHIDVNAQRKAAECYAAFTFAKQNSASWTKQLLLLFSNIDVIVEMHLKGNYNINATYNGSDNNLKFLFNPKEMKVSNGTVERRLNGLSICIENLILSSPKYFQSIPIFFPLNIAIDTLDKLILECMSMSNDIDNDKISSNKSKTMRRNGNDSSSDDSEADEGATSGNDSNNNNDIYNADKITLLCNSFIIISRLFQAVFQASGQHILRNYTQVSLILTALLRWSRLKVNKRLPGPILSVLEIVYSFFEQSGPYLKKNFIENVSYYCLESFNILADAQNNNRNVNASSFSSSSSSVTTGSKKKKRNRNNISSWGNRISNNNNKNVHNEYDFFNTYNQTLLNERLLKCIEILNLIVFNTSPKLGTYIRKLIHDKLYDIFSPVTNETKFLNRILMSKVKSRKAMYELLLTCTTIECASNVPSLYTFTNKMLKYGLNDENDDIVQLCRSGNITLVNMVKPTAVPFQTYVREISSIERKNVTKVVVNQSDDDNDDGVLVEEDEDDDDKMMEEENDNNSSNDINQKKVNEKVTIPASINNPITTTTTTTTISNQKYVVENNSSSSSNNNNNSSNNSKIIDEDSDDDSDDEEEMIKESALKKQKVNHSINKMEDKVDDDDDGFPEIVL